MKTRCLSTLLFIFFTTATFANNVQITNVSIVTAAANTFQLQFDVSWENSWRVNSGPTNYDGVWVFFKYKQSVPSTAPWAMLPLTTLNNVIPAGFDIYQSSGVSNKVGVLLYRDAGNTGIGPVTLTGVRLGIPNTIAYNIEVRSFGVEMVNIPALGTNLFQIGDGNGVSESLNAFHNIDNNQMSIALPAKADANANDDAELVTNGITIGKNDTITYSNLTVAPFPGFKSFWCMKYELTQGAYRDFLNTLTTLQQTTRTATTPTSATGTGALVNPTAFRNSIEIKTPASGPFQAVYGCDANNNNIYDEASDGEWIPCNYLTWADLAAWMDWAGLAPMTEVQYEYICRGSTSAGANSAGLNEFAWGTTQVYGTTTYNLTGANTTAEVNTNGSTNSTLGNAAWGATTATGPLRNGIFATATSSRAQSGASFYGVMDLSGNVYEYCVTLGNTAGRSCKYIPNGDGVITGNGNAVISSSIIGSWPGMDGNTNNAAANLCASTCEINGTAGILVRGGSWASIASSDLGIAYRLTNQPPGTRNERYGGRGVLHIR